MISGNWLFKLLLLSSVLFVGKVSLANQDRPMPATNLKKIAEAVISMYDSLPVNKNTPETAPETVPEKTAEIKQVPVIKEVPKSKKQVVPIKVSPTVKVLKPTVIKPRIIKPAIKIN